MFLKLKKRVKLVYQLMAKGEVPRAAPREVPAITLEEVAEARQFFSLDKFFIFGHSRSGTTLLTRLVRLHPKVHCNYQAHFFTRPPLLEALVADEQVGQWLGRRSNRWSQGRDLSPLALRAVADFILERDARRVGKAGPGCMVGDKSPNSLLDEEAVRLMLKVYPDARLIFIVRDGRDALVSHRFQAFIDRQEYISAEDQRIRDDYIRDPAAFLSGQRSIFTPKGLRNSARGWTHNVTATDQAARDSLGERYLSLRYEDLLAQPWVQMTRLWAFLGVDPGAAGLKDSLEAEMQQNPDADWQQQKEASIANSLRKGKGGTWRELFTPGDRQIFKEAAGQALIDWGYESNLDW